MDNRARWAREAIPWNFAFSFSVIFGFSFRDILGFESVRFQNSQIKRLVDESSQFIIAAHSPMIMAFPGACLLELTSEGIEEAEHFCVMRGFLNVPEKMLGEPPAP